jgi:hypothetical protein
VEIGVAIFNSAGDILFSGLDAPLAALRGDQLSQLIGEHIDTLQQPLADERDRRASKAGRATHARSPAR